MDWDTFTLTFVKNAPIRILEYASIGIIIGASLNVLDNILNKRIEEDERDRIIEFKALKKAYSIIVSLVMILIFMLASDISRRDIGTYYLDLGFLLHALFLVLLLTILTKSVVQIFYYKKGI